MHVRSLPKPPPGLSDATKLTEVARVDPKPAAETKAPPQLKAEAPVQSGTKALAPLSTRELDTVLGGAAQTMERLGAHPERAKSALRTLAKQLSKVDLATVETERGPQEARGVAFLQRLAKNPNTLADKDLVTLAEVLSAHPRPLTALGYLETVEASGQGTAKERLERLATMYPKHSAAELNALKKALDADLSVGGLDQKIRAQLAERGVSAADSEKFFAAFAEVREAYRIGATGGDDFQRANWIHTRIEVGHTLEAAKALNLSPEETLSAALGSLASDSFKKNGLYEVLTHNRAAEAMLAPILSARHFPKNAAAKAGAIEIAAVHQISPAVFMKGAAGALLAKTDPSLKNEVLEVIGDPLAAPRKGTEAQFKNAAAEKALFDAGVPGWAVPDPSSPHHGAALAAIAGDVWQYVGADGVIKIAIESRDPEHPGGGPFRDPTLRGALNSSIEFSFAKGMEQVNDARLQKLMGGVLDEARATYQDNGPVLRAVETRLKEKLGLGADQPLPPLAYWSKPVSTSAPLSPEERKDVDLVKNTFREVAAKLGGVPLDPFGTLKAGGAQ
ncbi:MAG: hypothetical protein U1E65_10255 [Myxococcota bacterium]